MFRTNQGRKVFLFSQLLAAYLRGPGPWEGLQTVYLCQMILRSHSGRETVTGYHCPGLSEPNWMEHQAKDKGCISASGFPEESFCFKLFTHRNIVYLKILPTFLFISTAQLSFQKSAT